MKPPNGLKAMPKELAVGAFQDGTQRIMSQLRDAGQREERSDYGGERIESAAADGARLAARSVEAFLKSGTAALNRNKGQEPPPDNSLFDKFASQKTASETDAASVIRTGEASLNLREVLPEQASVSDRRVTVNTKETPPLAEPPNADREFGKERALSVHVAFRECARRRRRFERDDKRRSI